MGVNASVSCGTRQVLVLAVRDVEMSLGVAVLLCETEIDNVDLVASFSDTHQEVIRLHIAMNKVPRMNVFYP